MEIRDFIRPRVTLDALTQEVASFGFEKWVLTRENIRM